MSFLDALLGRSKPQRANLDALFALPSAAITLEASAGLRSSGRAGVCFKPASGEAFSEMGEELRRLLQLEAKDPGTTVDWQDDTYGYRWVVLTLPDLPGLVTAAHMVNSTLQDHGFGPQLLCSVFGFVPGGRQVASDDGGKVTATGVAPSDGPTIADGPPTSNGAAMVDSGSAAEPSGSEVSGPCFLVYLYKRGTFYPFAPRGGESRDNELELALRGVLAEELPIETDVTRWFPLWGLPIGAPHDGGV